jgi:hypothetical protein
MGVIEQAALDMAAILSFEGEAATFNAEPPAEGTAIKVYFRSGTVIVEMGDANLESADYNVVCAASDVAAAVLGISTVTVRGIDWLVWNREKGDHGVTTVLLLRKP